MDEKASIFMAPQGSEDCKTYLYTHWNGSKLPLVLQNALAKQDGWSDKQQLSRVIYREMLRGSEGGVTGFGFGSYQGEPGYSLLVVDCGAQTVTITENGTSRVPVRSWSFSEFVALQIDKSYPWSTLLDGHKGDEPK